MSASVIWDWNGTLLQDLAVNHGIINKMLSARSLGRISLDGYREHFRMPIIDFYRSIGFTLETETFEEVAREYFRFYEEDFSHAFVSPDTENVLRHVQSLGADQYILSATNHEDCQHRNKIAVFHRS